jgi:replicative DNA helicase
VSLPMDKPLPNDLLQERVVLGTALLREHYQCEELQGLIRPGYFFDPRHRRIAEIILDLKARGVTPDTLAVHDVLTLEGADKTALANLTDGIALRSDVLTALTALQRMAASRAGAHLAQNAKEMFLEQIGVPTELLESVAAQFSKLASEFDSSESESISYRDAALKAVQIAVTGNRLHIYTGITGVDTLTGGFREHEVVVLAADSGEGKSLVAAQIRADACARGYHTLFVSAEMSPEHLAGRELAARTGITRIRHENELTPADYETLTDAAKHECIRCKIFRGDPTLLRICSEARKQKAKQDLDLLVIDYDELIDAPGMTEYERLSNVVRSAKSFAMQLNCTVVLLSQFNRVEEGKEPTLQNLFGTSAKKKYASYIIFLSRPWVRDMKNYDENEATIRILKARDGGMGIIKAAFNTKTLRFEDAPPEIDWSKEE